MSVSWGVGESARESQEMLETSLSYCGRNRDGNRALWTTSNHDHESGMF